MSRCDRAADVGSTNMIPSVNRARLLSLCLAEACTRVNVAQLRAIREMLASKTEDRRQELRQASSRGEAAAAYCCGAECDWSAECGLAITSANFAPHRYKY
jgi:hypothetical protein